MSNKCIINEIEGKWTKPGQGKRGKDMFYKADVNIYFLISFARRGRERKGGEIFKKKLEYWLAAAWLEFNYKCPLFSNLYVFFFFSPKIILLEKKKKKSWWQKTTTDCSWSYSYRLTIDIPNRQKSTANFKMMWNSSIWHFFLRVLLFFSLSVFLFEWFGSV